MRLVWAGIRREKGTAQAHEKPPLAKHIREMVDHLRRNTLGVRDRALILLGCAGAMRRGELVGLDVTDVAVGDEGLIAVIQKSMPDQTRAGRRLGIPFGDHAETCPVRAVSGRPEAQRNAPGLGAQELMVAPAPAAGVHWSKTS
ncbi:MAG: hypothetical protein U0871_01035 [Gemmataceae bacterium]